MCIMFGILSGCNKTAVQQKSTKTIFIDESIVMNEIVEYKEKTNQWKELIQKLQEEKDKLYKIVSEATSTLAKLDAKIKDVAKSKPTELPKLQQEFTKKQKQYQDNITKQQGEFEKVQQSAMKAESDLSDVITKYQKQTSSALQTVIKQQNTDDLIVIGLPSNRVLYYSDNLDQTKQMAIELKGQL